MDVCSLLANGMSVMFMDLICYGLFELVDVRYEFNMSLEGCYGPDGDGC